MNLSEPILRGNKLKLLSLFYNTNSNAQIKVSPEEIITLIVKKVQESGQYKGIKLNDNVKKALDNIKEVTYANNLFYPIFYNKDDQQKEDYVVLENSLYEKYPELKFHIDRIIGPRTILEKPLDAEIIQ